MFELLQSLDLELRHFPIGLVLTICLVVALFLALRQRLSRRLGDWLAPRWLFVGEVALVGLTVVVSESILRFPFVQRQLDPDWVILIQHTARGAYWFLLGWLVVRALDLFFWNRLVDANGAGTKGGGATGLVRNLVAALIFLFFAGAMMRFVFDRPVIGTVVSSGIILAVLGLASQNLLADLFAGVALTLDSPYRTGDWIELPNGIVGRVIDITWRSTRLLSAQQSLYVVPNKVAAESVVHNYGLPDHTYAAVWQVMVGGELPPHLVRPLLRQALANTHGVLREPAPTIRLAEMAGPPHRYGVRVAFESYEAQWEAQEEFYLNLWSELSRAGIAPTAAHLEVGVAEEPEELPLSLAAELRRLPILQPLGDAEVETLARSAHRRYCRPGDLLLREGEQVEALTLITTGLVEMSKQMGGRLQWPLIQMGPGQMVGALPLLAALPAPFNARAVEACHLIELPRAAVERALAAHPELLDAIQEQVRAKEEELARTLNAAKSPLRRLLRQYMVQLVARKPAPSE
jgi:small-conductance mechanosensitive channel/CRP-like cAMP-binding protein